MRREGGLEIHDQRPALLPHLDRYRRIGKLDDDPSSAAGGRFERDVAQAVSRRPRRVSTCKRLRTAESDQQLLAFQVDFEDVRAGQADDDPAAILQRDELDAAQVTLID